MLLRKSARMKSHSTLALEAFCFAFSRAMSEVSVPATLKPFCASHMELSPVPQPISKALQLKIGLWVTTSTRLKSGLPMSQGVSPDLYLSLKRSSVVIGLPLMELAISRFRCNLSCLSHNYIHLNRNSDKTSLPAFPSSYFLQNRFDFNYLDDDELWRLLKVRRRMS